MRNDGGVEVLEISFDFDEIRGWRSVGDSRSRRRRRKFDERFQKRFGLSIDVKFVAIGAIFDRIDWRKDEYKRAGLIFDRSIRLMWREHLSWFGVWTGFVLNFVDLNLRVIFAHKGLVKLVVKRGGGDEAVSNGSTSNHLKMIRSIVIIIFNFDFLIFFNQSTVSVVGQCITQQLGIYDVEWLIHVHKQRVLSYR